uniref:Uncharacterized protein n=2 Tax=Babesia bovis TaxID=5865 RepID=A7AX90_BABBO|eukprot:XP_001608731.1 hypothetical protein [Babesia bovis T2Bo]
MDYEFFKTKVRSDFKNFVTQYKSSGITIIYGICNKDKDNQQKANVKTIQKIRSLLATLSVSQYRFCLVPMLGLPVLTGSGTPMEDVDSAEGDDTGSSKNWESLHQVMSDCISTSVCTRMTEALGYISKKHPPDQLQQYMFHDAVLRIYSKFGSLDIAAQGYLHMVDSIKQTDLFSRISTADFVITPYIFCVKTGYRLRQEASLFEIYQYFCASTARVLQRQSNLQSLTQTCDLLLDSTMLFLGVCSELGSVRPLLWLLTFIHTAIQYIYDCVNSTDEIGDMFNASTGTSRSQSRASFSLRHRRQSSSFQEVNRGTESEWSYVSYTNMPGAKSLISPKCITLSDVECVKHVNVFKMMKRYIGLMNTLAYKVALKLSRLIERNETLNIGDYNTDQECYKDYRTIEAQLWQKLQEPTTQNELIKETVECSAVNFSQGDLPRFANVIATAIQDRNALASITKDCNQLGWGINLGTTSISTYAWIGAYEPYPNLGAYMNIIQDALHANMDKVVIGPNLCLTPMSTLEESVNMYLRALAAAKINIGAGRLNMSGVYGQQVKYNSLTSRIKLNIYINQEVKEASVKLILREERNEGEDVYSNSYATEEISLPGIRLYKGLNQFDLKHTFRSTANYLLDTIVINSTEYETMQKPGTPIPLDIINQVVKCVKKQIRSPHILPCLMLPTQFIFDGPENCIEVCAYPCATSCANCEPVVLKGVCNYICYQVAAFTGGKIVISGGGFEYDLDKICLYSQGVRNTMVHVENTTEGLVLEIGEGKLCNHIICVPVTIGPILSDDIKQCVTVYEDEIRADTNLVFTVLPPFCREVMATQIGNTDIILQAIAPYYTLVESVYVDDKVLVNEPTLLEPSSKYYISLEHNLAKSRSDSVCNTDDVSIDNLSINTQMSSKVVSSESTFSDVLNKTGSQESASSGERLDTNRTFVTEHTSYQSQGKLAMVPQRLDKDNMNTDTQDIMRPEMIEQLTTTNGHIRNTQSEPSTSKQSVTPGSAVLDSIPYTEHNYQKQVIVNYRIFRHRCQHHSGSDTNGLERLSDVLQYSFTVPQSGPTDVVIDYQTPPHCFPGIPFDARIVLRATRDLVSFDYEMDVSDHWIVEGPIHGRNQSLKCGEIAQLRFKMEIRPLKQIAMAVLPTLDFRRLNCPPLHKEIFLLSVPNC